MPRGTAHVRASRRETLLRWLPPVVWMAVIFGFSSLTGSELAPVSPFSTYGHLAEYAVLGALLVRAASKTWPLGRATLIALAVASAYGVTDELHQLFTPGRMADPRDWLADTAGAALAIACMAVVESLLARRSRSSGRP